MSYKVLRNDLGAVVSVNRGDGASVPIKDESHFLTIELRYWEADPANGALDLSNHAEEPSISMFEKLKSPYQTLLADLLNPSHESYAVFETVHGIAMTSTHVAVCYTDLVTAIGFKQLPGFQSSVTNLFLVLQGIGQPLNEGHVSKLRALLDAHGFSEVTFPTA